MSLVASSTQAAESKIMYTTRCQSKTVFLRGFLMSLLCTETMGLLPAEGMKSVDSSATLPGPFWPGQHLSLLRHYLTQLLSPPLHWSQPWVLLAVLTMCLPAAHLCLLCGCFPARGIVFYHHSCHSFTYPIKIYPSTYYSSESISDVHIFLQLFEYLLWSLGSW